MADTPLIVFIVDETAYGVEPSSKNYVIPDNCLKYNSTGDVFSYEGRSNYGIEAPILTTVCNESIRAPYYYIDRLGNTITGTPYLDGYKSLPTRLKNFTDAYKKRMLPFARENNINLKVTAIIYIAPIQDARTELFSSPENRDSIYNAMMDLSNELGYMPYFIDKLSDIDEHNLTYTVDGGSTPITFNSFLVLKNFQNGIYYDDADFQQNINYYLVSDEISPNIDGFIYDEQNIIDLGTKIGYLYLQLTNSEATITETINIYRLVVNYTNCYIYHDTMIRDHEFFDSDEFDLSKCFKMTKVFDNTFEYITNDTIEFNYILLYDDEKYVGNYRFGQTQEYLSQIIKGNCTIKVYIKITYSSNSVEQHSISYSYLDHITGKYYVPNRTNFYRYSEIDNLCNQLSDVQGNRLTFNPDDVDSGDRLCVYGNSLPEYIYRDRDTSAYYPIITFWSHPERVIQLLKSTFGITLDPDEVDRNYQLGHDYIMGLFVYNIIATNDALYIVTIGSGSFNQVQLYEVHPSTELLNDIKDLQSKNVVIHLFVASGNLVIEVKRNVYKINVVKTSSVSVDTVNNHSVNVYKLDTMIYSILSSYSGNIILPEWYDFWMIGYAWNPSLNDYVYVPCHGSQVTEEMLEDNTTSLIAESYTDYNPGPRYDLLNLTANYQVGRYTLKELYRTIRLHESLEIRDKVITYINNDVLTIVPLSYKSPNRLRFDDTNWDVNSNVICTNNGVIIEYKGNPVYYRYDYLTTGFDSIPLEYDYFTSGFKKYMWKRGVGVIVVHSSTTSKFQVRSYVY